ncbi:MAG: type 4a pilus biogenesis protein PilO [Candidatus Nealsonbacteria bacterium]
MTKNIPLIALGIIAMLLIGCAICPLFFSIKQNSETFLSQKRTLVELEKKSNDLKIFQSTYETYDANIKKMNQLLVDREEPIEFIEFLEGEAGNSKLTIDLTPLTLKAIEEDFWPSMSFRVDMAGSFQNFLKFLDKVESSPYLIALSGFSLNKPQQNTNGDITISFQMKVYTR